MNFQSAFVMTPDPIYVKMLPGGEATPLVDHRRVKYGLSFSPDGSQIAYGVSAPSGYDTYAAATVKGEPRLLLANAAALSWLDAEHVLFAEIRRGMHLGIVAATRSRSEHRDVYFPQHERAMAHYAYASPDRRWALVVEMDERPVWQPCRLVPLSGASRGRQVGPAGYCTGAGWSPDGAWMYFTAAVDEQHHLWRQRFPDGAPEQLSFGPEQEDGVAVAPDGSLVTSIGIDRRAIRIHDPAGDRPLAAEGTVSFNLGVATCRRSPATRARCITSAANRRAARRRCGAPTSRRVEAIRCCRASRSGTTTSHPTAARCVQQAGGGGGDGDLDRAERRGVAAAARRVRRREHAALRPARRDRLPLRGEELQLRGPDEPRRNRTIEDRGLSDQHVSGVLAGSRVGGGDRRERRLAAIRRVGARVDARRHAASAVRAVCAAAWAPDGKYLYLTIEPKSRAGPGQSVALPVRADTGLPDLPDGGFEAPADALEIPGARRVPQADIVPGLDPSTYAYVTTTTHRNLFRVRLP